MHKTSSKDAGFTLIELLVVVAIIGLLSSVVLASLDGARKKARDARRLAEIQEIAKAIELYFDDNGFYPHGENMGSTSANGRVGQGGQLDIVLAPYLDAPHDPLGTGQSSFYYYDGYQACGGHGFQAVISAINLEANSGNGNDTKCSSWGGEGGIGGNNTFNIVLGPSTLP